ncbi:hypothetical protein ACWOFR_01020 [Carnobacterium gallinarum]|uniref:hypothetical protein n=1 Tax=Carnobacterium gallinarum TaxID=2749 RepID=UPI00054F33E1|nr:hypothetical protein [Carnobacterium gallinarum]
MLTWFVAIVLVLTEGIIPHYRQLSHKQLFGCRTVSFVAMMVLTFFIIENLPLQLIVLICTWFYYFVALSAFFKKEQISK